LELAEFCYNDLEHLAIGATLFQMVMGKSPIMPTTWATHRQPPNNANEEVSMASQLDEKKQCLWEMAKTNFEKTHKWYKDFADKF
jgi:hypothetical protein